MSTDINSRWGSSRWPFFQSLLQFLSLFLFCAGTFLGLKTLNGVGGPIPKPEATVVFWRKSLKYLSPPLCAFQLKSSPLGPGSGFPRVSVIPNFSSLTATYFYLVFWPSVPLSCPHQYLILQMPRPSLQMLCLSLLVEGGRLLCTSFEHMCSSLQVAPSDPPHFTITSARMHKAGSGVGVDLNLNPHVSLLLLFSDPNFSLAIKSNTIRVRKCQ